ncbi:tetratricopeptide repeat protein [Blastococcus sp. KM273128]|uniref:cytochrome c-type biogenesis protein CcmH n=1 Tax=Blastococcus sp. KM273128 TaxID=2570314 RepID=UPI001F326526|nr:cytochrome c-type biogenesis protein CcmH [Blastococcus sp. KM273128]MCF6743337.1 tetratricopeptide repeat protein [Blastococcus sp. KM273128]
MSGRLRVAAVVLAVLALVTALWWRQEPVARTDPAEAAREIATGLRCPTCAGESAADSAAPAARGMRAVIAERVAAGETPEEIRAHFVARYGEWILLDPPREGVGWALVVLPGAALLGGVVAVGVLVTRRRPTGRPALTPADRAAAEAAVAAALARRDRLTGSGDDERLEAALQLLDDVRSGSRTERAAQAAEDEVLAEVLRITSPGPSPGEAPAGRDVVDPGDAPARARLPRPAVLLPVVAVAVVGAVAVVALPRALAPAAAGPEEPAGVPAVQAGAAAADLAGELLRQARQLEDEGRFAEAATAYRAVLEERPGDLAVTLSLAFALLRDDRPGEAVPLVRTVLDAAPEHPEALLMLGSAEHALGDPAAVATLRRFLELAPGHPAADAVRDLLGEP